MIYYELPFKKGTTMFFYDSTNKRIDFELNQTDYECTSGHVFKRVYDSKGRLEHKAELTAQETSALLFEVLKIMRKQNEAIERNLIRRY